MGPCQDATGLRNFHLDEWPVWLSPWCWLFPKQLLLQGFVLVSQAGKRPLCMVLNGLTSPNNYFLALLPRPDPPQYRAFLDCCSLAASKSCLSLGTQHILCGFIIQLVCGLVSTGFVSHFLSRSLQTAFYLQHLVCSESLKNIIF